MRLLILVGLLLSAVAHGANTSFEAYDYKKCEQWSITDDADVDSAGYKDAIRIEKSQKNSRSNFNKPDLSTSEFESLARVFSASRFQDKAQKNFISKFGVCTYRMTEKSAQFSCIPSQDFPFSGTTYSGKIYITKNREGSLIILKCVSGCRGVNLPIIYDANLEEGDSKQARNLEKIREDFRFRCGKD